MLEEEEQKTLKEEKQKALEDEKQKALEEKVAENMKILGLGGNV